MPKLNDRGIVPIPYLISILVLGLFGYFGYSYFSNSNVQEEDVLQMANAKIVPCSKNERVTRQFWSPNFMALDGWSTQNGQPCFYNRVEIRNNRQALRDLVAIRNSYITSPSSTTPGIKPLPVTNVKSAPVSTLPAKFSVGDNDLFTKFLYSAQPAQNKNIFIGYAAPEPKVGSKVNPSSLKGCLDFFPDTTVGSKINYQNYTNPLTGVRSRFAIFENVETYLPGRNVFESRVVWQVAGPMINVEGGVRYCQNVIVVPNTVKELKFYTNMKGYVAPTSPARTPSRGGGGNNGGGTTTTPTQPTRVVTPTQPTRVVTPTQPTRVVTPTQPAKFVGCKTSTTTTEYFSNCYSGRVQNSTNCDVMSYQMNTARCTFAAEVGEYCSSIMGGCNTRYNIKVVSRRSTNNPF
jgi:hypothetical protein